MLIHRWQVAKFQGADKAAGGLVLSARNQDLVFCLPLVGAILGATISAPLTTRFGRKWVIIAIYFLSYGGTILQTTAPVLAAFVVGRFWNSIMIAIGTTVSILYLSEVVPAKYRGRAVTSSSIFNLISGVIATVICNATHTRVGNTAYQIPLACQAILPTLLIPLTMMVPESPFWLLTNGREDEARRNLRKLRGYDDALVEDELRVMKVAYEAELTLTAGVKVLDLFRGGNLRRTLVSGSMYSVNQISGVILSTTYATIFLTTLGVGNPFQLTIAASCCTLAGTLIAPFIVDKFGRRPTAIIGMSTLMVIDFLAGGLAFKESKSSIALGIAALSFIFNAFWGASFYALSVTLPTEIPTARLRNLTTSYTLACSYTTAVITTFAVPQIVNADAGNLGAKAYLVFGGCVLIVLVVYYLFLPETAGRTFAEIDEMYAQKVPVREWKNYQTSAIARQAVVVSEKNFVHV
jgi:sugar porter (SP) family MFS transporter